MHVSKTTGLGTQREEQEVEISSAYESDLKFNDPLMARYDVKFRLDSLQERDISIYTDRSR